MNEKVLAICCLVLYSFVLVVMFAMVIYKIVDNVKHNKLKKKLLEETKKQCYTFQLPTISIKSPEKVVWSDNFKKSDQ